jgi:DNA polymerase
MFHPAFLLRSPERKREAWRDLLALRAKLEELA